MAWKHLYQQHVEHLEDFWGRRNNGPQFSETFSLFGRPIQVTSNQAQLLTAVAHSKPLYSTAPLVEKPPFNIHMVVRDTPQDIGDPSDNLLALNQYTGHGQWLAIQIGQWGHAHVDLAKGHAVAVLTPQLANRPELVSSGLLNTLFNNLLTGQGFPMLHCTGLLRDDHLLLIMAPHNTGKSTTAFRLMLAGYSLVSDSQIYLSPDSTALQFFGFPTGRIKLRQDMVPHFPQVHPYLRPEPVRDEIKQVLDIREWQPDLAVTTAVTPHTVSLCLLSRQESTQSVVTPATVEEVTTAAIHNSLFYDDWSAWQANLAQIDRILQVARCYHLVIGTETTGIISAVDQIFSSS